MTGSAEVRHNTENIVTHREVLWNMKEKFVMKTLKRMAAIGTGVAMVGATLTGAMAQDLADYPSPFVVGGVYDDSTAVVVGDAALAIDTLGVGDISEGLQFESRVATESEGGSISVEGGKTEQVPLGKGLSNTTFFDTTLEDEDIASFWDGTITFQGDEYDAHEELQLPDQTQPVVATSLSSSEDDYATDVFLEVPQRDLIQFAYVFDESVNLSTTSADDPLDIDFLGYSMKITSIPSATSIVARVGEEHYLAVDDTVTIEIDGAEKTVTLKDVSSSSAVIEVDGVTEIISDDATETVNGVEVTVDEVFSRTERSESSANIFVGKESSETYNSGDEFINEDEDNPDWVWRFSGLRTAGTSQQIEIENDFTADDPEDHPPAVGECIDLPNDYAQICFDSLTVEEEDYATYTFELETSSNLDDVFPSNTSVPAIYASTSVDEGFELSTSASGLLLNGTQTGKEAKEVWLYTPAGSQAFSSGPASSAVDAKWLAIFYKDTGDNKVKLWGHVPVTNASNEIFRINYGNTEDTNVVLRTVAMTAPDTNISLRFDVNGDSTNDLDDGADDFRMEWGLSAANASINALGDTRSTEEAQELKWSAALSTLGTKDEDHRTLYGIIIRNPDSHGASDEVELSIPQDQVFANIIIKGTSTTVSSSGGSSFTPVSITVRKLLASEVSSPSDYQLILVGGPCANALVEDLFDMTCDGWAFQEGEAVVKVIDNGDNVAMLVAGTTGDDTRRAALAVKNYADYEFSGSEVVVSGTSLTDINVEASA